MNENPYLDTFRLTLTLCVWCADGCGGVCHTRGCAFWCCPAPGAEQAAALRRAVVSA